MKLPSLFGRCAVIVATAVACLSAARAELPMVELGAGMHRIEAELAHTDQARQIGLMNRRAMPQQRGMVFVFTQEARHCMWMKNTLIPLSVAFMDRDGRILNIADMQPQSEVSHCAAAPARFALEMNAGWFAARGIGAGAVIRGVDRLPAGR
ncbi:DUF192 domain-containing protein [Aromatoleum petrolei]|uniref:DUF192 domain-containing protein n=1 Tax=Aromatoleum petrolei TaxID=76116 RepID=A0ABX1MW20_9RHOO|nr:DUF192 domain-containing protein [Aromatoleum petrolei]NMF90540.1 DUF192 domain-containing protein [Aromatoleum petrolei]QTQ35643.1 Uncharacterized protein ToN1_14850 [Aromatoleum petrolei]